MPKQFDTDLNRLTERLLAMAAVTERMITDTVNTFVERDMALFEPVREAENTLDRLQREIDEDTVKLITIYTPVASDLRLLLMVSRINAELERIGDQAMNIGFYTKNLLKHDPLKPLADLPTMGEMGRQMLSDALDAFSRRSADLAMDVIKRDDKVDAINDQVFRDLMDYVVEDPQTIGRVIELILISRALERIADHAVSIAEDVVYMIKGEDIRHIEVD